MLIARYRLAGSLLALAAMSPAHAAANLIKNGSFEATGTTGAGAFAGWMKTGTVGDAYPAIVIAYYLPNGTGYANGGAFGETVAADNNALSKSPDPVGGHGAYFVSDYSASEAISQLTYLKTGNYRVGFSYYLTANGLANPINSSIDATILGLPVASTMITGGSTGQTWFNATGVAGIGSNGHYLTSIVFNSNGFPAKDIVIDRVYAIRTTDAPTQVIPPGIAHVPEPQTWALLIVGFGLVGLSARRRKTAVAVAC